MIDFLKGIFEDYLKIVYYINYYSNKFKKIIFLLLFTGVCFCVFFAYKYTNNAKLLNNSSVEYYKYINKKDSDFLNKTQYGVYEDIRKQIVYKKILNKNLNKEIYCFNDLMLKKENDFARLCLNENHSFNQLMVFAYAKNEKKYKTNITRIKHYQNGCIK